MINCDNIIKSILENEFGRGRLEKDSISEESYNLLYNSSFIRTSSSYMIRSSLGDYCIKLPSGGVEEENLSKIVTDGEINSVSFGGKVTVGKVISFKISRSGAIQIYNQLNNPLMWDDIFSFIDKFIYRS